MKALILVAVAALVAGASAFAGEGGVVASASGGYGFTGSAAGSFFDVGPFTWNVQVHDDGSAHGRFTYTQVRDGVELSAAGSLTCAFIEDGHVWAGGIIESSSRASLVGLDMWFQAHDHGEGAGAPPDMSSTLGAGPAGAGLQYCVDHPVVRSRFSSSKGTCRFAAAELRRSAHEPPVATGRDAMVLAERAREVTLIRKAGVERDPCDRQLARRELRSSPLEPERAHVLGNGDAVLSPEGAGDVRGVTPDGVAELVQRHRLRYAGVQELPHRP